MKWYLSLKALFTDLKKGLAIKPKTDENQSDYESPHVIKVNKNLEMAAVEEKSKTHNGKKPRILQIKKNSELQKTTIPTSKLGKNTQP